DLATRPQGHFDQVGDGLPGDEVEVRRQRPSGAGWIDGEVAICGRLRDGHVQDGGRDPGRGHAAHARYLHVDRLPGPDGRATARVQDARRSQRVIGGTGADYGWIAEGLHVRAG